MDDPRRKPKIVHLNQIRRYKPPTSPLFAPHAQEEVGNNEADEKLELAESLENLLIGGEEQDRVEIPVLDQGMLAEFLNEEVMILEVVNEDGRANELLPNGQPAEEPPVDVIPNAEPESPRTGFWLAKSTPRTTWHPDIFPKNG
ncbi:unnamed protein product [Bursaphelenchus xylophilus]|uniref:(pine wood nematode) hypothetical protein n=1 Tax=Bursaphelenchus xylophilus TaxID=6326 RepID=A0A1I7RV10_BURXY|nr:unnamed protein product [Bursaphelenchus xylophilus]CAG9105225.1 unnamed protein product [Bursaphelenchus xylophilus]